MRACFSESCGMKLRDLLGRVWSTFSPAEDIQHEANNTNTESTPSCAGQRVPSVARHSLPAQRTPSEAASLSPLPLPSNTQRLGRHSAPLAKLSKTWAHALERVSPALGRPSRSWVQGGKMLCAPDQTAWPAEGERAVAISMALARRCAVGRQLLELQHMSVAKRPAQHHGATLGSEQISGGVPNQQQQRQSLGCVGVPEEPEQAVIVPAVPGTVPTHGLRLLEEWAAAQEALGRAGPHDTTSDSAPKYNQHVQGGVYPVIPNQTASSDCETAPGTGTGTDLVAAVGVEWWTAFLGARGQLLPAAACAADFLGCGAFTAAFTALQLLRLAAALEVLAGGGGGGRCRATAGGREVAELLPPFAFLGKVRRG